MILFYFRIFRGNRGDATERPPVDPRAFGFDRGRFGELLYQSVGMRKRTNCKKAGGSCSAVNVRL